MADINKECEFLAHTLQKIIHTKQCAMFLLVYFSMLFSKKQEQDLLSPVHQRAININAHIVGLLLFHSQYQHQYFSLSRKMQPRDDGSFPKYKNVPE